MLEFCSTEPVLTEKCFRQSRQRKGIGLRLLTIETLREPQSGQAIPFGQRCSMNHASAFSSESKRSVISRRVIPFPVRLPWAAALCHNSLRFRI